MSSPKLNDYPVTLRCNLGTDISAATVKRISLKKPGGATVQKTAVFTTDGTDGLIEYDTVSTDLNKAGTWLIEPYVKGASFEYYGKSQTFTVDSRIGS